MKQFALVLSLAGLVATTAAGTSHDAAAEGPKPTGAAASETIKIDPSKVICRVVLIDRRQLASDIPGVISFIGAREGDAVNAGELVAKLRDEVAAAELKVAQKKASSDVAILHAQKAHEFSEVEYQRQLTLYSARQRAATELDVQRSKVIAERSELEVEQARLQQELDGLARDEAAAKLKMYQIEAPLDGVVTNVYRHPGEAVRQGDPILEIVSTDRVRVEGYIPVEQAVRVGPGAYAEIRVAKLDLDSPLGRRTFSGKVTFVDPTVSLPGVKVWVEVPNPDGALREGLETYMTIYPNKIVEREKTVRVDR